MVGTRLGPGLIISLLHRRWNGGILDSPRCLSVRPSVCRQGFRNFLKKLLAQFISCLAFTLMGCVPWPLFIFVFLASFSALWWPNIWPKMGFPELFEKTIGSIHFLPGIYPYGLSFLTLNIFVLLASFSALWWPNIWPKIGFPEFLKKLLAQFISYLAFILMGRVSWPLYIFVLNSFQFFIGYFWMGWVVIRAGVHCPHLWAQLVVTVSCF